jgi:hypothetical protein
MDLLIKHINDNSAEYKMTIRYGTLSSYFANISSALKSTPPPFSLPQAPPDLLPYSGPIYEFFLPEPLWWTGFYSSRPALKTAARALE